ncbi:MAG: GIY-YIG nuclease family protein [Pseudomonadota bacterium]
MNLSIGRLGEWTLPAGIYGYVGSAFGPGGLAARAGRHWRGGAKRRWHLDHLRPYAEPVALWWTLDGRRREALWARVLKSWPGVRSPVPGFGASDQRSRSHLFLFPEPPERFVFVDCLVRRAPRHAPVEGWSGNDGTGGL